METSYYTQFHTSAEVETIFGQVFGGRLSFSGFEPVGPRRWVQETRQGFKYLFHLHPQRNGVAYLPCGAISIDFVPRLVAGRFKIQTGPKHAGVHLSFGEGSKTRWEWMIDKNRENFREKVEKIAGESVTEITAWFHHFKSIVDVVAALDQEKRRSRKCDFYCYPVMVLAYSFALARVGRIADARSELEKVLNSKFYDANLTPALRDLFEAEVQEKEP